jgi:hypothetical protein
MRRTSFLVTAALLCGAAAVLSPPARAAGGQASFAVKPVKYDPALSATKSYFILQAKRGAVISDQVRIVNTGSATGTAFLYPVDATTGQTSGAVYLSRQSPRRDVGAWVRLARRQVTLAPGASAVVPFAIRVPAGAHAGDHLGGIVAENSQIQGGRGSGALRIRIKHLTIAAVELQLRGRVVAGVAPSGVKAGGQQGWQYVYIHLRNTGNVMVKPSGSLVIRNATGRRVASRKLVLDTFVPGTAIDYPVLLPHRTLAPGSYRATVTLRSSNRAIAGYRTVAPPAFSSTQTFPFTVSSAQQKQVFSGVAPVTAPTKAAPAKQSGGSKKRLLGLILFVAALVLLVLLVFHLMRKRRAARTLRPPTTYVDAETASMLAATAPRVPAHAQPAPDEEASTLIAAAAVQEAPEPAPAPAPTPAPVAAPLALGTLPPPRVEQRVADSPLIENLPGAALGLALLLTAAWFAT